MKSALILIALAGTPAALASVRGEPARDPFTVREFRQAAISPDGTRVAYVETATTVGGGSVPLTEIWIAKRSGMEWKSDRLTACRTGRPCREREAAWSADGRSIAFLSDAEKPGQMQLYVSPIPTLEKSKPRRLTSVAGDLSGASWSPDGKSIALLFIEGAPRAAGPLEAMTPRTGEVDDKFFERRIALVDVASSALRPVSPADLYVHEYDWSPDGRSFVVTAGPGAGDSNWYTAKLMTVSRETGKARAIYTPAFQIAAPRWSPDGRWITFIEGLMSDEGSTGGEIFLIPAEGGDVSDLTPRIAASATFLSWRSDSRSILFSAIRDGIGEIDSVGFSGHAAGATPPEILWSGAESFSEGGRGYSFSRSFDGEDSAVIRSSFDHPPEVWAGPIGKWTPVTRANDGLSPFWGAASNVRWRSDGFKVQGWLVAPPRPDRSAKSPLIVWVHGGPAAAAGPQWLSAQAAALSERGYYLFFPNPRGSFGQGEDFTRGNVRDFGYGDLRDILAGVDAIAKSNPIDEKRIGLWGWSYGGYMTMWAVTQTNRFRAAVAGAGIANWQSYYGENDIDEWMIPYFGASVYDDSNIYARSSPITYIKNVTTPTLVLVGERDGECPAPQSLEFWHALKTLGVKTGLVVYAGEGHAIRKLEDRKDIVRRLVAWFEENMK